MKFLPDWRQAWRWWSVRVSALGAILLALAIAAPDFVTSLWQLLPDELLARLPRNVALAVPLVLQFATIVARLLQQHQSPTDGIRGLWRSTSGKAKAGAGLAAAVVGMIAGVIAIEGGYVNHPADPGGETNMGITKSVATRSGYVGPMRALPRDVAHSIYYRQYLVAPGYAPLVDIDAAVTEELFDTTVNMGAARPSRWFQSAINEQCGTALKIDGRVGPGTIAAYRNCQHHFGPAQMCIATLDRLDARQRDEYARLVVVNPKLRVFYRGWIAHRIGNVDRAKCKAVPA